jgi:hypothetical protein
VRRVLPDADGPSSQLADNSDVLASWVGRASRIRRSTLVDSPIGPAGGDIPSDVERELTAAGGGGRPLDVELRAPMEQAFGTDLGRVRVHDGARASRLNDALGARAFTLGQDIFVRQSLDTTRSSDQHLLAHELAHTVQQRGSGEGHIGRTARDGQVVRRLTDAPLVMLTKARVSEQAVVDKHQVLAGAVDDLIAGVRQYLADQATMSVTQKLVALKAVLTLREAAEAARVKARESIAGVGVVLKAGVDLEYDQLGAGIKTALVESQRLLATEQTDVARSREIERTNERMLQTLAAVGQGQLSHLLVSPDVIYSGDKGVEVTPYPSSVRPDQEYMVRLPPTVDAAKDPDTNNVAKLANTASSVKTPAQPLAILVVAGGHGDIGDMFEKGENTSRGPMGYTIDEWLALFVQPLVDAGVRAHNIVLDACLSASMIPAFEPLLTGNGQIFAAMYSLESGNLVDDATWVKLLQVIEHGGGDVRTILQGRMKAHLTARVDSHKDFVAMVGPDAGPVPPDVFAVYDFASKQLRYDNALDQQFQDDYEPQNDSQTLREQLARDAPHVKPVGTDRT